MAVNSLVHRIEIDDKATVETAYDLKRMIGLFRDAAYEDLDGTYVVERVKEHLSDGSIKYMIRVREAEDVR